MDFYKFLWYGLRTPNDYYQHDGRKIINNILNYLHQNEFAKFSLLDVYHLNEYYHHQMSIEDRIFLKNLTNSGRLEIAGNGFVNSDYSVTRFESLLSQFSTGFYSESVLNDIFRQDLRLRDKVAFSENNGFGMSPSVNFLFRKMAYRGHAVSDVSWRTRAWLKERHLMEFYNQGQMSSLLQFGQVCDNIEKCCQIDYLRMDLFSGGSSCKIELDDAITVDNIEQKASIFKAQIQIQDMETKNDHVVLVPVGGDFFFKTPMETELIMKNYYALKDYFEKHKAHKISIKFSSLNES